MYPRVAEVELLLVEGDFYMDTAIVYTAIGFGGLASILAFFLFFSRAKLQDTLADAQEKLTREQSRSAEALIRHAEKQKSPAKPPID